MIAYLRGRQESRVVSKIGVGEVGEVGGDGCVLVLARDEEGVVEAGVAKVVHGGGDDHAVDVERRDVARDDVLREEAG